MPLIIHQLVRPCCTPRIIGAAEVKCRRSDRRSAYRPRRSRLGKGPANARRVLRRWTSRLTEPGAEAREAGHMPNQSQAKAYGAGLVRSGGDARRDVSMQGARLLSAGGRTMNRRQLLTAAGSGSVERVDHGQPGGAEPRLHRLIVAGEGDRLADRQRRGGWSASNGA